MYKFILISLFFIFIGFSHEAAKVRAQSPIIAGSSSKIATSAVNKKEDSRVLKLKNYLKGFPLEESARDFVEIADKYNMGEHVYLVAAISGVESTFGKFIPTGSYNAWGFGIPTGAQSGIVFTDWKTGIEEVTKSLATTQLYLKGNKLEDLSVEEFVYQIGPTYAASPVWAQKVCFFLNKIEATSASPDSPDSLSINL